MEAVTLHIRMQVILPPMEGIINSNGKGVQEKAVSKGVGSDSQGLFSRDFETKIIVFIDDLTLTVMLFSQLTPII